ncbi:MAG: Lrp/AsnC family transcriptional regulator [Trueperaceae bacterium]
MKPAPYAQLDSTDRTIVDFLREDGRMPYREIARRLAVSESMVRKRVNRLLDEGWMRILAISDPLQLGVPILATTYLNVSPRAVEEVTDSIARCEAVRYVALGIGAHNVVVESLHVDNSELHRFIQRELGLEGIISSETIQVVKIKKSVWDWEIRTTLQPTASSESE